MDIPIISLVGNLNSATAKLSDVNIDISVLKEACNLELAPTSSTTASLVMGDALAMVVMKAKEFKSEDFAFFHPAGQLGKRLLLKVSDIMKRGDELPIISVGDSSERLIYLMSKFGLGIIAVCDDSDKLIGIITDGDLRRGLQEYKTDFFAQDILSLATMKPITISANESAYKALIQMEKKRSLNHLPVVDNGKYIGMLSLHDLVKAGI
jgi:arabinose-5-phosphate isomerase